MFHEESPPVSSNQFYKWIWIALNFFYGTFVNTAECSYTFISLFISLSLCCLYLLLVVFMEELASLEHLPLVSRCFKITLSVSPPRNKNAELKRLFTMKKIRHFFSLFLFAVCSPCIICMGLSGTCTCRTVWKVVTEWSLVHHMM